MSDLLDKAIALVRTFPAETQNDVAHMLLTYCGEDVDVLQLTPEEEAAVTEAEAARGAFATEGEMRAIWTKVDL